MNGRRGARSDIKDFTRTCCGCGRAVVLDAAEEYQVQIFCSDCSSSGKSFDLHYCQECNTPITVDVHGDCPKGHRVF